MEAIVSDILQSRKREPDGLKKTAAISLGVHVAAVALILGLFRVPCHGRRSLPAW